MNKKGFLLAETILGLFLLGLVTVTCLPIVNTALDNMRMAKHKMEMLLIAESTIEQIKAFDYSWSDEEYIFDIDLKVLIDILNNTDTISVRLPLDNDNQDYNYYCTINKRNNCKDLWEIQIEIGTKDNKNKINSIDIFTLITVPQMDGNSNE